MHSSQQGFGLKGEMPWWSGDPRHRTSITDNRGAMLVGMRHEDTGSSA